MPIQFVGFLLSPGASTVIVRFVIWTPVHWEHAGDHQMHFAQDMKRLPGGADFLVRLECAG